MTSRALKGQKVAPKPKRYSGEEAPPIAKTCGCGRSFTTQEWLALPLRGRQLLVGDEEHAEETFEFRNCVCGSTLAIEVESE